VFLILAGYSVWKSERFQSLLHGVSQARLSAALGVPVDFETVDVRILPPSVSLVRVSIGNDPKLALPPDRPLLTADEISIGGGQSLSAGELRLGRIRALHPRILLAQLPDGRWNLPPGLANPVKRQPGLTIRVGSLLVQQGSLEFAGRRIGLDGQLDDFAAELTSTAPDRYRGVLVSRRAAFRLRGKEPLVAGVSLRFALDGERGLAIDELRLEGPFGRVIASGSLEDFARPRLSLLARADVSIAEVERVFHSPLGFEGQAAIRARVEVPPSGDFRVTGTIRSARARKAPFVLQDVAATVSASRADLVARIESARYAGGEARGTLRIAELTGAQVPMTLAVEANGVSLEGFFADLGLPGTGLSGAAGLQLALRWGAEGIARANGGGLLQVKAGPAASAVRGRFGVPTEGGGPIAVTGGRIVFEACTLRLPRSTIDFTGGIPIGGWQPDFDFRLRSRDLSEIDRVFQNFVAAGGSKPAPLGLGGSGEVSGHVGRSWSNPEATAQLAVEDAHWGGVGFGSARGTVDMSDGAFVFRPLRVYDGDAAISLEGRVAFRPKPGREPFDLVASARAYPLKRLLDYLELDLPIDGKLSGTFPLAGSKEALSGGGAADVAEAVVWGQKIARVTARAVLSPGKFALEELRAPVGGGMVGGRGAIDIAAKRFEARLAGDGVPLDQIDAVTANAQDLGGNLSFQLEASGALDAPDVTATASISQARLFGHAVPAGREPRLTANVRGGRLDAELTVPGGFRLNASGDIFRRDAPIEVALDAPSLPTLLLFTPAQLPEGYGGALKVAATLRLPGKEGDWPTGNVRVGEARLDLPDRPGALRLAGPVALTLADRRLTADPFKVEGEGSAFTIRGSLVLASPARVDASVQGDLDPALLAAVLPDFSLGGRLHLDVAARGNLEKPQLSGQVTLRDGRYRLAAIAQIVDDIEGTVRFSSAGAGDLEARAKVGGGEAFAAGTFGLDGLALGDFRVTIGARRVTVRYPQDVRLVVDADLVASGGGAAGNVIRGEVTLVRGTYSRDFDLALTDLLARSRPSGAAVREEWKERTRLEVHIVSSQALEVRNNLARLTGTVDLLARGTLADPTLVGQVTLDEGGRVTFRDVRYDIESGNLTFASTRGLAPILDLRARADVKGYDVTVNLAGTWPRIESTFTSDPPLTEEELVNLLLTGTRPGTATSGVASGTLASTAGTIVGGAATGVLTRPAQKLFKLERFQIDPVFTSSGLAGATTTVGKQISPNWSVTYSQPLFEAGSREPIVEVEGRISQTWVLRLRHDENGVYLIDLRRRTRS
jgi:translocation and assembly module TamB